MTFRVNERKEHIYIISETPLGVIGSDTIFLSGAIKNYIFRQLYSSKNTRDLKNDLKDKEEHKNFIRLIIDIRFSG